MIGVTVAFNDTHCHRQHLSSAVLLLESCYMVFRKQHYATRSMHRRVGKAASGNRCDMLRLASIHIQLGHNCGQSRMCKLCVAGYWDEEKKAMP